MVPGQESTQLATRTEHRNLRQNITYSTHTVAAIMAVTRGIG